MTDLLVVALPLLALVWAATTLPRLESPAGPEAEPWGEPTSEPWYPIPPEEEDDQGDE